MLDQLWLASPSPALRLWPGAGGATWRLNAAAIAWARGLQLNEASWRLIAASVGEVLAGGPEREGRLATPSLRWRSLPMSTGWLVWLMPDAEVRRRPDEDVDRAAAPDAAEGFERRTDRMTDAAGAGLWQLGLQSGAFEWNREMRVLHGLPEGAEPPAFDAYAEGFVHADDRAEFRLAWQNALDAVDDRFDIDFRIVRPDGEVRWIEFRAGREPQADRSVVAGIALDATDRIARRSAGGRAGQATRPRERPNGARSEFLARMSHELRTPLNAVLGFAQLIEHDGAAVPVSVQLERVVHIREAGEQLLHLIGDVLDHLKRETPADEPLPTVPAALDDGGADDDIRPDRSLSVLYIEDNPVNVILVEELVAMRPNTTLRCAVTGLAGVALAAAAAPHVVLVDMQLPDIDGFEVLRRLRANRALDRSAVIALSANGMGDDIALALAAGFDDYWTKPINFRRFLSGLDSLAGARG